MKTIHRTVPQSCPGCHESLNAAVGVDCDDAPAPGTLSVCKFCASFLVFGEDLTLSLMTQMQIADLPDDVRIELQRIRRELEGQDRESLMRIWYE